MTDNTSLIAILIVLIVVSAFFSGSEAAMIAVNKVRLRHMIQNKKRGARRVYSILQRMDKFIATILVGNNLVNTAIASISTLIIADYFGEQNALIYGTAVITVILIIFADLTPKVIATRHPESFSFLVRHLLSAIMVIFGPIARVLTWISNGIIKMFGGNPHYRSPLITEEEMKMMITIGKEEGFYGDNERKMLERIFHFDEIEVRDVMTPVSEMTCVSLSSDEEALLDVLMEEGHNRIPVYDGSKDHVVGILYVRDLIYLLREGSLIKISDILNAPYFVTADKKVTELLKDFQTKKVQIAIVRDERTQRTLGLVTLEDLVEEIVGELEEPEAGNK